MFLFSSSPHSSKQQARAEQEEEFISNTLFKKIQALQKEKETLAVNYEKEEEFLTNELSRKLMQVNGLFDLSCPTYFLSLLLSFSWKNGFKECFISQVLMWLSPRFCDLRMLGYGSCRLWSPPQEGGMRRMRLLRTASGHQQNVSRAAPRSHCGNAGLSACWKIPFFFTVESAVESQTPPQAEVGLLRSHMWWGSEVMF